MKRLLPIVLIALLFLVNSCDGNPIYPDEIKTALAEMTRIAASWTPIPTQTANPNLTDMINWLNTDLSTVNTLERTMDAEYQVTNISVINPNGSALVFRVDVGCICMHATDCCIPERTFVVIIEAMRRNSGRAVAQVPWDTSEILVVCYDHTTDKQIGSISTLWQNVRDYIQGTASGYQLGVRVTRTIAP